MPNRHLPVRPDLDQLKHQAKDLLRALHAGDPAAIAEFLEHHPDKRDPAKAKLADAQLALARSYQSPSWPRLVQACHLTDAIWRDDIDGVRRLVLQNPKLIHESALVRESNWGPPMSYAANLGRDRIIQLLHDLGAKDHGHALDRAALQGQVTTARLLHRLMGSPRITNADALTNPAYTLNVAGTELLLELGAPVVDNNGQRLAPVATVLETDSRNPAAKHRILALYERHGFEYPDTPTMALHRGRTDLLEEHLRRDPNLPQRRFSFEEIYPPELGCHEGELATHGTQLAGTTLLHMCADYGELEIARWLLDHGADVNARAELDPDGFGGHTPLFNAVVAQPNFWVNHHRLPDTAEFTRLLLDHGADVNARASLRKELHAGYEIPGLHEYRDVTPLSWGERFHFQKLVSKEALRLIGEAGGGR